MMRLVPLASVLLLVLGLRLEPVGAAQPAPPRLLLQQTLLAGESSWPVALPVTGATHVRVLVRVTVTPVHEFGLGIRVNNDLVQAHYAGGDSQSAVQPGASWRAILRGGVQGTALLVVEVPFYRSLPFIGLQQPSYRSATAGSPDPVFWDGTAPAALLTLLALENTDDNYGAFAARPVDGGVLELWGW
jgi:hypothetical protein